MSKIPFFVLEIPLGVVMADRNFYEQIADEALALTKERDEVGPQKDRPGIIQLPLWAGHEHAAPSGVLRSAIFRVTNKKIPNRSMRRTEVASWPGWTIRYSGIVLSQSDLDVWLAILDLVKVDGPVINTSTRGLLKKMGRSRGSSDVNWLLDVLDKLNSCGLEIETSAGYYGGSLVDEYVVPRNTTKSVEITINRKLAMLFNDGFTKIPKEERRVLRGELTKWLHGYILSHKATPLRPSWIKLQNLHALTGSEDKAATGFRRRVKNAMLQLEKLGVVESWSIEDDVLRFVKPSQKNPGGIQVLR